MPVPSARFPSRLAASIPPLLLILIIIIIIIIGIVVCLLLLLLLLLLRINIIIRASQRPALPPGERGRGRKRICLKGALGRERDIFQSCQNAVVRERCMDR